MSGSAEGTGEPDAHEALALLEKSLSILDQLGVPAEIGANVDLAICRLRERIGLPAAGPEQFDID
jgi:hypothetical protein